MIGPPPPLGTGQLPDRRGQGLDGLRVTLVGDVLHSRVARSNVLLLSTLGGLEIFGMNGIVLGPLIAAMFMVVWDILSASRRARDLKAGG